MPHRCRRRRRARRMRRSTVQPRRRSRLRPPLRRVAAARGRSSPPPTSSATRPRTPMTCSIRFRAFRSATMNSSAGWGRRRAMSCSTASVPRRSRTIWGHCCRAFPPGMSNASKSSTAPRSISPVFRGRWPISFIAPTIFRVNLRGSPSSALIMRIRSTRVATSRSAAARERSNMNWVSITMIRRAVPRAGRRSSPTATATSSSAATMSGAVPMTRRSFQGA